jgi:hypothetical protein
MCLGRSEGGAKGTSVAGLVGGRGGRGDAKSRRIQHCGRLRLGVDGTEKELLADDCQL